MAPIKKLVVAIVAVLASIQLMAVNLNTASAKELESLKGIGPATAKKIVQYRKNAPFERVEQIMEVKGIGEKTFKKIKSDLEV